MGQISALPNEASDFLARHPEVQTIQLIFTNQSGVPRGKNLRRHDLMPIYEHGRYLPGSMLALDITGEDVEASGLVWEDGDADRLAKPVAGTLVKVPWHGEDHAQVILSLYELEGQPCAIDPRHVLQRVIDRFRDFRLTPVVACELEFYLLDRATDPLGRRQPPASPVTGYRPSDIQGYGLRELDDFQPFFRDLYACCDAQGIPAETAISEYAPGQLELTLHHRADALRATDEAIMYKRAVKGVAIEHGFEATFMAKPFTEIAGSGMHLHVSLAEEGGKNAFASDDVSGSELLKFAIGGMQALLHESMAVFAPNANSYRRFRANSYAPVAPTWGINNRTVSFRVPAGPAHTRHIEHRVCGADANPYLAVAALLAAVHHGIAHRIDPGKPIEGNGYSKAAEMANKFPANWYSALDLFANSKSLKDYFGNRFHEVFTAVKRTEQDRFFSRVTQLDYDWYLRNA